MSRQGYIGFFLWVFGATCGLVLLQKTPQNIPNAILRLCDLVGHMVGFYLMATNIDRRPNELKSIPQ